MSTSLVVRIVFWLWLGAAFAAGHFRLLQRLPALAGPLIALGLAALVFLAYRRSRAFGAWVDEIDLRGLVLLHVTRFVGFYFLLLYQRGELPARFAVPAGVGDIAVAALALVVALYPFSKATRPRAIHLWNIFGLIDILLVLSSAARLALGGGRGIDLFTQLPLSLLPTFLVPLIVASHLVIFARLPKTP